MNRFPRIGFSGAVASIVLLLLLSLSGCYTVPETGRKAFSLGGDDQLAAAAVQQFGQMKQEIPISGNRYYNQQLQRVGTRIRDAIGYDIPNAEWEFVVFENDALNAFAMPGGKVGVYTGMMDFVRSDDELAIVIGHEIAHVIAKHANERYSQQVGLSLAGAAAAVAVSDQSTETQAAVLTAVGLGSSLGILMPYSRLHESEADHIGLLYSARAGYDPRVATEFWERMGAQGGDRPPEFLSTHPDPANRVRKLEELMPRALEEYAAAQAALGN